MTTTINADREGREMTVAELIEELKRLPAHYPVLIETYEERFGGLDQVWTFVDSIEIQTNLGDLGCAVKIVGEEP